MRPYPLFPSRDDDLAMALVRLAETRGVHDISIRALAAEARAAPGSLTYQYRDKDAMFAACARSVGSQLSGEMEDRLRVGGLATLLPTSGDDDRWYRIHLKVWAQLTALGLDSEAVAQVVAWWDRQLRALLARRVAARADLAHGSDR